MKKMPGTIAKPSITDVDYNGFYFGSERYVATAKETYCFLLEFEIEP